MNNILGDSKIFPNGKKITFHKWVYILNIHIIRQTESQFNDMQCDQRGGSRQATLGFRHVPWGYEGISWSPPGILSLCAADVLGKVITRVWCLAASLAFVHQMPGAAPTHVWQSRCLRTSHRQAPWRPSTPIKNKPGCSIKRKETPTQGTPWMTLKNFIPGRTPDPKTTHCMVPFIWNSLRGSSTEKESASVGGSQCGKEGWWHCSASGYGDSCTTGSVFLTSPNSTLYMCTIFI